MNTPSLPALIGTPKQVAWAEKIRSDAMTRLDGPRAYASRYGAGPLASLERAIAEELSNDSASYWIDNRTAIFSGDWTLQAAHGEDRKPTAHEMLEATAKRQEEALEHARKAKLDLSPEVAVFRLDRLPEVRQKARNHPMRPGVFGILSAGGHNRRAVPAWNRYYELRNERRAMTILEKEFPDHF